MEGRTVALRPPQPAARMPVRTVQCGFRRPSVTALRRGSRVKNKSVRRPSVSWVVAIVAVVLAASGTAIAATKLVSGDSLIKRGSLSGNRLRKHTLTGTQINLNKLGKVPSANRADVAATALSATDATHAKSADNATTVGGRSIRWLLVNPAGTIVSQSGGFTVSRPTAAAGYYIVDAGSPAGGHAILVSSGGAGDTGFRGSPVAAPCGTGPDGIDCSMLSPGANNGDNIVVVTFSINNTTTEDHSYYLTVY
jgi:hypothetical protein